MADELIDVSPDWAKRAYVDEAKYKAMYKASIQDPARFWGEHGKRIDWIKPYSPGAVRDVDYTGNVHIRWYHDGVLNVSANCVDRHLAKRADQVAIIWEGDDPSKSKKITYRELHGEVSRMANALKELGVKKGDRAAASRRRSRKRRTRCWPVRASAPSIPSCSAASRPTAWPTASSIARA